MKKTYSLTAAQNMHYQWIKEYKTQQVSGLSIVAAFQADIDIPQLKRSIELEKERYSCLRLRFTKPDENGEIKQYIADWEPEDMPEMDMTGIPVWYSSACFPFIIASVLSWTGSTASGWALCCA